MGHEINRHLASYGGIGLVHGIIIDPNRGELDGGGMALAAR